jgi:hypothetical protein
MLWVRSYWTQDQLLFPKSGVWGLVLLSERGRVTLRNYGDVDPTTGKAYIVPIMPPWLSFPHYFIVILAAAVPIALFVRQRNRRKRLIGFSVIESSAVDTRKSI